MKQLSDRRPTFECATAKSRAGAGAKFRRNGATPLLFLAVLGILVVSLDAQEFGTIRASTTVNGDGTRSMVVNNPDTGAMEETVTDAAGKTLRKATYQVDEAGHPKNAIFYDAKGKVTSKAVYQRDSTGRIDRETIFAANNQVIRKRVYHYGAKNKVSGIDEFDGENRPIVRAKPATASRGRPDKKRR